jgi:hypothetical protein
MFHGTPLLDPDTPSPPSTGIHPLLIKTNGLKKGEKGPKGECYGGKKKSFAAFLRIFASLVQ